MELVRGAMDTWIIERRIGLQWGAEFSEAETG
jgi:hypothetical protein